MTNPNRPPRPKKVSKKTLEKRRRAGNQLQSSPFNQKMAMTLATHIILLLDQITINGKQLRQISQLDDRFLADKSHYNRPPQA